MNFIGKTCPYCKSEFREGDDIVVCSVCEMPHHKECWIENKACTTFGCTGTISGIDEITLEEEVICTNCGMKVIKNGRFCGQCGAVLPDESGPHYRVSTSGVDTQQHSNYYSAVSQQADPFVDAYIASNQSYYNNKFREMDVTKSNVSWNWASFLFGAAWFAYRKMYVIAIIYAFASFFIGLIPIAGIILNILICTCSGLSGNSIYKKEVEKEVNVTQNMEQINRKIYLKSKGGTSVVSIFAICGIPYTLSLILALI